MNENPSTPESDPQPAPLEITPESESQPIPLEIIPEDEPSVKNQNIDVLIEHTIRLLKEGINNTKKGCKEVLVGSLNLIYLNLQHRSQGTRNDLVPDGKKSGFNRVLDEVNLPSTTAYRWMSRAREFVEEIGVSDENFPAPDSVEWARMLSFVLGRVEALNLLGLPIRALAIPKDEEIMMRLRVAAESGDEVASQLLEELDAGVTTMEEATSRYCRVEKSSKRTVPAMLQLDPKTLKPKGLMMKALNTLEEGFLNWDKFPVETRLQAIQRVREVISKMPKECAFKEVR